MKWKLQLGNYSSLGKATRRFHKKKKKLYNILRYMAAGKHIGKVVIKIRDEETDKHAKPVPICLNARPQVLCKESSSYVIVGQLNTLLEILCNFVSIIAFFNFITISGGLGGFGLELCDWLIVRGARNIVLSSRNGLKNGYQSYKVKLWKSYGVNVVISTEDITTETGVANLLQTATSLGPVVGIFNVALVVISHLIVNLMKNRILQLQSQR